jgi:predicted secreted Zn-dependent protease
MIAYQLVPARTRQRTILSLLLIVGALSASGCAARRGVRLLPEVSAIQINVNTRYYPVDLSDPRSLSRAMWDQGLSGVSGAVGSASPAYRWTYDLVPTERGCVISSLRATGEFTITLPRWTAPTGTSQERRLWWQSYASSVAAHENTHVRIFEDHLREVLRTVEGASGQDCNQARTIARNALQRITEDMNRRQAEFDRSDGTLMIGPPPP